MSDNNFRRKNNCPYCGYFCDAATIIGDENAVPKSGDLSFCLKCSEAMIFDKNLKLVKFDLNSIKDTVERIRLKGIQTNMRLFWEAHPELAKDIGKRKVKHG